MGTPKLAAKTERESAEVDAKRAAWRLGSPSRPRPAAP